MSTKSVESAISEDVKAVEEKKDVLALTCILRKFDRDGYPTYELRQMDWRVNWQPWQERLFHLLETRGMPTAIHWIWSSKHVGATGRTATSQLINFLYSEDARLLGGKPRAKHHTNQRILMCDLPYSTTWTRRYYDVLMKIKARRVNGHSPHVIVFARFLPTYTPDNCVFSITRLTTGCAEVPTTAISADVDVAEKAGCIPDCTWYHGQD